MTIHSIGIGINDDDRKNAVEVMQNGDNYVYGIGGYDGTNYSEAQTLQEVVNSLSSGSGGGVGKVDETSDGTGEIFNTYDGEEKNIASGASAHAEGVNNKALGQGSHVEGVGNVAQDLSCHAEGNNTKSIGAASHTEGFFVIANNLAEHAQGGYNKSNSGETPADKTLHSIGIGTGEDARKNAVEVMKNGDVYINGVGSYDGTNYADAQTLQEVVNSQSGGGVGKIDSESDGTGEIFNYYDGMKQYNNYLTEDEASQILSNFVNYDGTKGAMFKNSMWLFNRLTEQNLHCECAPNYNKWALYVTMNKFASDHGNVINKWIGEDKDKFIIACYDLSTAQLSDADRPHWVRSYFNL